MTSVRAFFTALLLTEIAGTPVCETDFRAKWPSELEDGDLHWKPNAQEDQSGPKYRLFTTVDVREVMPNLAYHFELDSLDGSDMVQFLISVTPDPEHVGGNHGQCLEEEGALQSLSDVTQHSGYNCFKYLLNREEANHKVVPFIWRTPACGCFIINAEILDAGNNIYTDEDDEFQGLTIKSCVAKPFEKELMEDIPLSDQPMMMSAKKGSRTLMKRLKKKEKKHKRRRGKKFCCKKGIQTHLGKHPDSTCGQPDQAFSSEALHNFGLQTEKCNEIFKACCENHIVGEELFNDMKQKVENTRQKYKKLRNKMKEERKQNNANHRRQHQE